MRQLIKNAGFTMMEILIYLAVTALIVSIGITSLVSFSRREALEADTTSLAGGLRDARAQTLASVNGSQYGVYIAASTFTLFTGATYTPGAAENRIFNFSPYVRASSTISSVVFSRLTGNSTASGTIDVYLVSDPATKRSVNIGGTGLVNILE